MGGGDDDENGQNKAGQDEDDTLGRLGLRGGGWCRRGSRTEIRVDAFLWLVLFDGGGVGLFLLGCDGVGVGDGGGVGVGVRAGVRVGVGVGV